MSRRYRRGRLVALLGLVLALVAVSDLAAQERQYQVGAKDVLKITVFGHDDLSRAAVVSAAGAISLPLLGDVPVAGLTIGQVETRLRELLGKDYLVDPKVAVSVQEYHSQRVFLLGEIEKPGTYALSGKTMLLDLLSLGGGIGKTAGRQVVIVRSGRADGPADPDAAGTQTVRISLQRLLAGDPSANLELASGDTVIVPRQSSYFVQGEVLKPGAYALDKDTNALEAVTQAGGLTEKAAPTEARIIHRRPDGTQETIAVDLSGSDGRARDALLTEGDTLLVPVSQITFFVLGEVKKPGSYMLHQATTALEGIALAGGFTDKAAPNRTRVIRTHKDGRQETLQVDLNEVMKRGRKDRDVPLSANDVIVVPESYF